MQDQMYELKDNRMENLEARLMEMKKKLNDRRRISRKTRGSHPWKQFKLTLSVQEHQN